METNWKDFQVIDLCCNSCKGTPKAKGPKAAECNVPTKTDWGSKNAYVGCLREEQCVDVDPIFVNTFGITGMDVGCPLIIKSGGVKDCPNPMAATIASSPFAGLATNLPKVDTNWKDFQLIDLCCN